MIKSEVESEAVKHRCGTCKHSCSSHRTRPRCERVGLKRVQLKVVHTREWQFCAVRAHARTHTHTDRQTHTHTLNCIRALNVTNVHTCEHTHTHTHDTHTHT